MQTHFPLFFLAAFFEIFGCFAFWLYFRLEKTPLWLGMGCVSLILFAYVLTKLMWSMQEECMPSAGGIYNYLSFNGWFLDLKRVYQPMGCDRF